MKLDVEVGMLLNNSLVYYHDLLTKNGLKLIFACITHDIYYTKEDLAGLTENEMKNKCIRLRFSGGGINTEPLGDNEALKIKEQKLIKDGYKKVFNTIKLDFQYRHNSMYEGNYLQLQDIKDIGLLVYYYNKDYTSYTLDEQRKMLFNELNSYGFNFKETDLGLDKLRTLYYKKKMYSKNQNG